MTSLAPATWWRGLGGLTRSGSAVEGLSWALYDFANTIFSYAVMTRYFNDWIVVERDRPDYYLGLMGLAVQTGLTGRKKF